MPGLLDYYFNPQTYRGAGLLNMPTPPMAMGGQGFGPTQEMSAQPRVAQSDPMQVAPQQMQQAQQQQPSFLGGLSGGLANNSNTLLAMGAQLLSGEGLGGALQGAMVGGKLDREQRQFNATEKALAARGVPKELAGVIARNPQLLAGVLGNSLGIGGQTNKIKEYQFAKQQGFKGSFTDFMKQEGSEKVNRISRLTENLMATGDFLDPQEAKNVATGIVDGRLKADRHPVTGEVQVVDMATGRPAYRRQTAQGEPQQPAPAQQGRFGQQFPAAFESFGIPGTVAGAINTISDTAGMGPVYPEVQQTQSDFGVLRESLLNDIASAYKRQPPSWLLKEIRGLTPSAGSPFEGASGAQAKLKAIGRQLENELSLTESSLQRELSPKNRQELEERRSGLEMGLQRVSGALSSFGPKDKQGGAPQPGAVEDGYRFKGGNPADPNSWERVQ